MMACKFVPLPESSTPIFSFSISFPFSRSQGLREQAALVGVLDLAPASDDAADAEGLLAGIGLRPGEEEPADRSVLHSGEEVRALQRRSAVVSDETRQRFGATVTQPREDPSYGDTVRSANERAYAEDAKRFRG